MQLPTRPIVPGFHPDPSICAAGGAFYIACSSFEYAPGLPIYRSTDLRTWHQVANALDRPSQLEVGGAAPSAGIFAPTLRHHDGRFWLITTNLTDRDGHLLVTAEDPAGPWSEPVRIATPGIDPDLCWDSEGNCYLTWSGFGESGPTGIQQVLIDPVTGDVLSEAQILWQGTGGKFPEGPHLYQVGDFWYLLIAEGGTERGHAATIARSTAPHGPFEPSPWNPLLTARGFDTAVQNTGHADLVETADGQWALVYLGTRPRGASPEWHVLGRETFASQVVWKDDWPLLGEPINPGVDVVTEALGNGALPLSWVAPGRFPQDVLEPTTAGWTLSAAASTEAEPSFVGRRQEHLFARVRADLNVAEGVGGLELRIDPRHALQVNAGEGRVRALATIGGMRVPLAEIDAGAEVTLEIRVTPSNGSAFSPEFGPDELVAGIVDSTGVFVELGRLDGRYVSTEVASGMTGRMVGLFCESGSIDIWGFTYTGSDDAHRLELADRAAK